MTLFIHFGLNRSRKIGELLEKDRGQGKWFRRKSKCMIICRQVRGSNPVRETVNEEKGDNCRGGGKFCKGKRRWNPEYKWPLVGTGKTENRNLGLRSMGLMAIVVGV